MVFERIPLAQHSHLVDVLDSHASFFGASPSIIIVLLIFLPLDAVVEEVLGRAGHLSNRQKAICDVLHGFILLVISTGNGQSFGCEDIFVAKGCWGFLNRAVRVGSLQLHRTALCLILVKLHISNGRKFQYRRSSIKTNLQSEYRFNQHMAQSLPCLAMILAITSAFRFSLTEREPALSLTFAVNGHQTFSAISSGQQQHNITILAEYRGSGASTSQILSNQTGNDIEFSYNYKQGTLNVTILSSSDSPRNVSFDFYSEDDPLVKMIDKKDIKYVEEVLGGVFKGLTDISRNQQFHIQRDESHKSTLEQSESSIKWMGIIKIIFLLASALIQLWIMKGFFKGNHQSYQPVETM